MNQMPLLAHQYTNNDCSHSIRKEYNLNDEQESMKTSCTGFQSSNTAYYYRFEVTEVFKRDMDHLQMLKVIDKQSIEYTVELREDWFETHVMVKDIIYVIGETELYESCNEHLFPFAVNAVCAG